MKRWTFAHEALFCCGVACCSMVAVALLVAWPIVLVPGLWRGYSCWESDEC